MVLLFLSKLMSMVFICSFLQSAIDIYFETVCLLAYKFALSFLKNIYIFFKLSDHVVYKNFSYSEKVICSPAVQSIIWTLVHLYTIHIYFLGK